MTEIPYLRHLLTLLTRQGLTHSPHLLARWPFPAPAAARQEEQNGSGVVRLLYGGADEKKESGVSSEHNQG